MVVGSPHHLFNFLLSYCVHFNLKNIHIIGCFTVCIHYEILHGAASQIHGPTSYCFLCVMATLSLFVTWRVCYLLPPLTVLYNTRNLSFEQYQSHFFSAQLLSSLTLVSYEIFYVVTWYHAVFIWLNLACFMWYKLLVHPCYCKWLCFLFYKAVSYSTVYVDHIAFVNSSVDLCWGWVRMSLVYGFRRQECSACCRPACLNSRYAATHLYA